METGYAYIFLPGELVATRLGMLELEETPRSLTGRFTYSQGFLTHPKRFEIDPRLPLTKAPHLFGSEQPIFGAFEDASPDAWGRHVIENKLKRLRATRMEYLIHSSSNRIGAIDVSDAPQYAERAPRHGLKDLDALTRAAELVEAGEPLPPELEALLDPGPSAGGARPKDTLFHEGREWIAKFPSRDDKLDIGRLELAVLEMARAAGISVPPIRLETIGSKTVLLIERFDRVPAAQGAFLRRHVMSALTAMRLGEADSRHLSYPDLAALLREKGGERFKADCIELYRRMAFNMFVGNDDDHGKNHAFLLDATGRLELSPVYDIVPKARVGRTYFLAIGLGDQGREATVMNALSRAEVFGISRKEAVAILEEVREVVLGYRTYLAGAGLDAASIEKISGAFLPPEIDNGLAEGLPRMSREAGHRL